ncbi:MAG: glycoside hydrolase family 5 protein [Anaerolineae bacterium]|nr:glycoside hydrolase family 5 protein [Phycisphaerae bacterium]
MLRRCAVFLTLLVLTLARTGVCAGPADSEAMAFSRKMGIGWNLGNTLEATGINGSSVREFETCWGNPVTTREMFDGIKAAGFKSVRIPVAWSNLIAADHTIDKDLMARVEAVAKYALDNDLYVIINIHWDGGWIKKFSTDYEGTLMKYKMIWRQIAERFKDHSDHLIFESMNEEGCFDDLWNRWGGEPAQKDKAFEILNNVNLEFVNLVRASGNNAQRYLLIAGYATDIACTVDPAFKMPKDPVNRSMVSVHYYDPSTFTLLEKDADWGKAAHTWGTDADVAKVKADMLKVQQRFIDQGIPVVLGEFGCSSKKDPASTHQYLTTVCETAYSLGIVPMLWDIGEIYDRRTCKLKNPELGRVLARIAATP